MRILHTSDWHLGRTLHKVGLAQAQAKGGRLLRLEPGSRHRAWLRLRVFQPQGRIESAVA